MSKRKTANQTIERHASGRFITRFADWVVNWLQDEDVAFDFKLRPVPIFERTDEVEQTPWYVQLKASRRFDDSDTVWWDLETDYLQCDCLAASVPVALMVYERRNDSFHWCELHEYCWDVLDVEKPDWRDQTTVRVSIERDSLDHSLDKGQFAHEMRTAQRRISVRESVATMRRETVDKQRSNEIASTEQYRSYKRARVETGAALMEAGDVDQAIHELWAVRQLPELDEPTLNAIVLFIDAVDTDSLADAFTIEQLTREAIPLADEYDRPAVRETLAEKRDALWELIEEEFVGARFQNTFTGIPFLVLEVLRSGDADTYVFTALVQESTGEIERYRAGGLVGGDDFELIESGESRSPREEACDERAHEFDRADLQEHYAWAKCQRCGLSHEVLQQWLGHDVPYACAECDATDYDTSFVEGEPICSDCLSP